MKHYAWAPEGLLLIALFFSSCRTNTEPTLEPVGMQALINDTLWVADSVLAGEITNGSCHFLMVTGWTVSPHRHREIMLEIPDSLSAPASCSSPGNYVVDADQMLMTSAVGSMKLEYKSSTRAQGTFEFHGAVFREDGTTTITDGKFNAAIYHH